MTSAWKDGAEERLTSFISDQIGELAPFITGWCLVATFVDDEGDSCTAFNCMDGQRRGMTLGMLTHILETEKARLFWDEKPDD